MLQTSTVETTTGNPSAAMPHVRAAVPDDYPQIMHLAAQLWEENGVTDLCWSKIEYVIQSAIYGKMGVVGVIGGVGQIQGGICLQISTFWYSNQIILEELFNFVPKEFRRSNNAKALIDFADNSSLRLGVPLLIGVLSNDRTKEKIRLYSRRLGPPSGAYFLVNAKSGS